MLADSDLEMLSSSSFLLLSSENIYSALRRINVIPFRKKIEKSFHLSKHFDFFSVAGRGGEEEENINDDESSGGEKKKTQQEKKTKDAKKSFLIAQAHSSSPAGARRKATGEQIHSLTIHNEIMELKRLKVHIKAFFSRILSPRRILFE